MNTRRKAFVGAAAVLGLLGLGGYGLYWLGVERGMNMSKTSASTRAASADNSPPRPGDVDPTTGRRVLYWHDPMVPGRRFDAPGRSPFMDMQLVPVYEPGGDAAGVSVSPRQQQSLGIRTSEVVRSTLTPRIAAVGTVAFNERDQAIVQARATGYVERLHVRATLDRVEVGQPLADLYVPEWIAAQEEFLLLRRMRAADLTDAARQRMRQVGMSDVQIARVEELETVEPRITLRAPISGVVVELAVREGMTVMAGETLFRLNGTSTVWVNAAVPESQAALLRPGGTVEARSAAIPGTAFRGALQAVLPEVDADTRTITARIELANPNAELAAGMFVDVEFSAPPTDALTVPTEAVIETGERAVVIVASDDSTFQPVDVELGIEADGRTEIKTGLTEGQRIVVSGQFLIDSEASLRATTTRMEGMQPQLTEHAGEGTVTAVGASSITLSHGPIASIQWGSMTMEFALPDAEAARGVEAGQSVRFAFVMGDDGKPRITRIEPIAETLR